MIGNILGGITFLGCFGLIIHFTKMENLSPLWLIISWCMALLPISILLTLILLRGME